MKYVVKALVTGRLGRKVLHFVTFIAAAMLFLNSPEFGGKCWFGLFLPVLMCCCITCQRKSRPLFAVLLFLDLSFYSTFFNVLLKLIIAGMVIYFIAIRAGVLGEKGDDE